MTEILAPCIAASGYPPALRATTGRPLLVLRLASRPDGGSWNMSSTLTSLEALARELRRPEPEVEAMALEAGVRQLWREYVLGRYLRGEVTREQAVEDAGIDWVELAERQHAAMKEDLAWAMSG
jgi:hypothetical protein